MKRFKPRNYSDCEVVVIELQQRVETVFECATYSGGLGDLLVIRDVIYDDDNKQIIQIYSKAEFDLMFEPLDEQAEPETDDGLPPTDTIIIKPTGTYRVVNDPIRGEIHELGEVRDGNFYSFADDKTIRVSPDESDNDEETDSNSDDMGPEQEAVLPSDNELIETEYEKQLKDISSGQARKNPYV